MNWGYISGFFDADGSISLVHHGNSKYKTVQLAFHNNELELLELMKDFVLKEIGVSGTIKTKKPRSKNHSTSYELVYVYFFKVNQILKKMNSIHPKKCHRISISFLLEQVVPRNGKYSEKQLLKRQKYERQFYREF